MHTIDHASQSQRIVACARAPLGMLAIAAAMMLGGCQTDAQNGALLGGAIGAGAGAIIGHNSSSGKGWAGAGIGAAAGALGGYLIGNEMDKSRSRRENPNEYWRYDY